MTSTWIAAMFASGFFLHCVVHAERLQHDKSAQIEMEVQESDQVESRNACTKEASSVEDLAEYLESKLKKVLHKGTSGLKGGQRLVKLVYKVQKFAAGLGRLSSKECSTTDLPDDAMESLSECKKTMETLQGPHYEAVKNASEGDDPARSLSRVLAASFNMSAGEEADVLSKLKPGDNKSEVMSAIDGEISDMSDKVAMMEAHPSFLQTEGNAALVRGLLMAIYTIVWFVVVAPLSLGLAVFNLMNSFAAVIICSLNALVTGFIAAIVRSDALMAVAMPDTCYDILTVPMNVLVKRFNALTEATDPL